MKHSVIVATYNAPRSLDLVLCGLTRQSTSPGEIVIADDGSGEETATVVGGWRSRLPAPVHHVWQADRGFRKPRILNEAVWRSTGDYLIFLDGDAIPHSRWVSDHLRLAREGRVLCGRRVRLGPRISRALDRETVQAGRLESLTGPVLRSALSRETKRYTLGVRLPVPVARCFHPRSRKLMGVNFSLPRRTFESVNGYDEAWGNWGEDRDLELRLRRAGARFYPLLNRAVVYHIYHDCRQMTAETRAMLADAEKSDRVWCGEGLDAHESFDPHA